MASGSRGSRPTSWSQGCHIARVLCSLMCTTLKISRIPPRHSSPYGAGGSRSVSILKSMCSVSRQALFTPQRIIVGRHPVCLSAPTGREEAHPTHACGSVVGIQIGEEMQAIAQVLSCGTIPPTEPRVETVPISQQTGD
eukprot:6463402-Amphidinium_carterae.2